MRFAVHAPLPEHLPHALQLAHGGRGSAHSGTDPQDTLGSTHADANYALTRAFYAARGFIPVEEFADLWPGIPCLLLVKPIEVSSRMRIE